MGDRAQSHEGTQRASSAPVPSQAPLPLWGFRNSFCLQQKEQFLSGCKNVSKKSQKSLNALTTFFIHTSHVMCLH